jgi:hypothetical protein
MTVLTVRYEVRQESVPEVEEAVATMMAAIERERPAGVRYTLGKLPDGVTFVGVVELADGAANPLLAIPAARDFQQRLPGWVVGAPPAPEPLAVVGSYDRPA